MVFKWKCKNTISKYNELDFFADIIVLSSIEHNYQAQESSSY